MKRNRLILASALLLASSTIACAQIGGSASGGMTTTGSNAAASALGNITGIATGCGGTTNFVRADGTCQVAGGTPVTYVGAAGGSANAYTIAAPTPTTPGFSLVDQYVVRTIIPAGTTNTGAATLNVNSTGAKPIVANSEVGLVALVGGEILAGVEYDFTATNNNAAACGGTGSGAATCYVMSWLPQSAVITSANPTVTATQWASVTAYDMTAASQTITLPSSVGLSGNGGIFINAGANAVTLAPTAASGDSILYGVTTGAANASVTLAAGTQAMVTIGGSHLFMVEPGATPVTAVGTKSIAAPAGPNSTASFTMQGLSSGTTVITTSTGSRGQVTVTISGNIISTVNVVGDGIVYQLSFGSGNGPASNAALTGTQVGSTQTSELATAQTTIADYILPFSKTWIVTGLSPNTSYYFDLAAKAIGATGFSFTNVDIAASEIQ